MIKKLFHILLLGFFILQSCKHEKPKNIHKGLSEKWYGTWVTENPFLLINQHDTSRNIIVNVTQLVNCNLTEFHIEKTNNDSVEFIYADTNKIILKMNKLSNDTLYTTDGNKLFFNDVNNNIIVVLKDNPSEFIFSKAPHHFTKKNHVTTTFRNMLNSELHKYSYVLIDSVNNWENRQYVSFFGNEKVRGLYNFENFKINLFGNDSKVSDAISVTFTSDTIRENLGAIFYSDSMELYTLEKDNLKSNNYYKKEKKICTLMKQKWGK